MQNQSKSLITFDTQIENRSSDQSYCYSKDGFSVKFLGFDGIFIFYFLTSSITQVPKVWQIILSSYAEFQMRCFAMHILLPSLFS